MKLKLIASALSSEQLQALLVHFPQLHSLKLQFMQFDSLAFLEPVRATLRVLSFNWCGGATFHLDLVSLRALQPFSLTRPVFPLCRLYTQFTHECFSLSTPLRGTL